MKTKKIVIEQTATGEMTYVRQFVVELSATADPERISQEDLQRLAEYIDSDWDTWEVQEESGPSDCESSYVIGEANETNLSTLRLINLDEVTQLLSDSEVSP